ncbi:MAG: DegT/DnrJ/EryC1/StrS family aminotransferase [Bryobacteraceae bacterium]|nr:DegT/DnrJ/EryC1/StrS family aminotransferase [Bryobacteraceae bacterium]
MRRIPLSRRMLLAGAGVAMAARRARAFNREIKIGRAWPEYDRTEEEALLGVLRSGKWGRIDGSRVAELERQYGALLGARHCVATANGTSALIAAMNAIDIGPGDEVLLPPYTFVASVNIILIQHALPVFVDSDRPTFQIDVRQLAARTTPQTKALIQVHLGGATAGLDASLKFCRERGIKLVEDACQAHLGEWRGKKVGTLGDCGTFSFQASKNLNSGEGGALVTNDEALFDRAWAFHGNGRARRITSATLSGWAMNGANLRLTEFQGALLLAQMTRLERQSQTRETNAAALTKYLKEIPGIHPQVIDEGCTRNAWHLYMLRYDPAAFAGLPRAGFLKALQAEGVSGSGGYTPLNREPFLRDVLQSRHYRKIYGDARLRRWHEENQCPQNDRLCEEAVWFTQDMLLGEPREMEYIAEAVRKIQKKAPELARQA